MFFLFAYNHSAGHNAAADKEQGDPQHEVTVVAGRGRLRKLRRYGVGFFDFLGAVFVAVILIAAAAVPMLGVALGILGRRLGGDMLEGGVILRVKPAVGFAANFASRFFGAGRLAAGAILCFKPVAAVHRAFAGVRAVAVRLPFTVGMPVVDRYGHLGGVARLVGDNDSLPAVRRGEDKAAAFIKRDRRAVYGDGIHVLFGNGDRLRIAVGLAVLNAADYRQNVVKRYAVGTKVCYVQALINEHCINDIFPVGIYAERLLIPAEYESLKLRLGEIPIGHQIRDKHGSAVVGGVYRHRLRFLKEQSEGERV